MKNYPITGELKQKKTIAIFFFLKINLNKFQKPCPSLIGICAFHNDVSSNPNTFKKNNTIGIYIDFPKVYAIVFSIDLNIINFIICFIKSLIVNVYISFAF